MPALVSWPPALSVPSLLDPPLADLTSTASVPVLPAGSRVLVTGAAGFIGSHLSFRLTSLAAVVVGLDNFNDYYSTALKRARQDRLLAAGVTLVQGDQCDDQLLQRLFAEHNFTHVAALAAQAGVRYSIGHPQAYVRANVQCFVSLLETVRLYPHVPVVYASSSSVYGTNTKVPFSEADSTDDPASLYAASKKMDEQVARVYHRLYGLRMTGLRFFTVYGPWGRPDMAYFSLAAKIAAGEPIKVATGAQRDFTYVEDIVDGVSAALALGADEEVFNLGNHRVENVSRLVDVLEQELGIVANRTWMPLPAGDVPLTNANTSHARALLGYEPNTTIDVGLREFVRWFRSADYREEFAVTWESNATLNPTHTL